MIIDFPNEVDIALNYTKAPGYSQAGEEGIHGSWVAATYLCMEVLQLFINRIVILLRAR